MICDNTWQDLDKEIWYQSQVQVDYTHFKQFKHENERMSHSRITNEKHKPINKLNFSAVLLIIKYELHIQGYIIITLNKNVDALSN